MLSPLLSLSLLICVHLCSRFEQRSKNPDQALKEIHLKLNCDNRNVTLKLYSIPNIFSSFGLNPIFGCLYFCFLKAETY